MSTTRQSHQSQPPRYAQPSRAVRAVVAFIAVLVSSTLLGGMLGLFEMRSEDAAMARATRSIEPASMGLAVGESRVRPRT